MLVEMTQAAPVLFGIGAVNQVGKRMKNMGATNVLCVYDKGVETAGLSEKVLSILKKAELTVFPFNEVLPDSPDYLVDKGGKLAREKNIDGIVVIGGGSSIDTAKGIRVLATNEGSIHNYLDARNNSSLTENKLNKQNQLIPLIAIPTTAGTGSEVTRVSVIKDTQKNYKDTITNNAATLAILDPELTLTLPAYPTAATGMDAFSHAAESMTSIYTNPKTELLALDAISRIVKWLPEAVKNGNNLTARRELLLASNFAGMAMCDGVAHMGHNIAHMLGQEYHIDHGSACALSLPECMAHVALALPNEVKKIGIAMEIDFEKDMSPEEIGEKVADEIRNFTKKIGIKSLKELGYSRDDILTKIPPLVKKEETLIALCPRKVTEKQIDAMIANMYDKY